MAEYCQDPNLTRFVPVPVPYTADSARFFIETVVPAGWQTDNEYNWAIRTAVGEFMGMLGARRNRTDRSFDIGFWLGAPHRGRGFATEAAKTASDWLFEESIATHLSWEAIVGNDASIRVARKLGFRFTGTRPATGTFRDDSHPICWHAELEVTDDADENATSWQSLEPS